MNIQFRRVHRRLVANLVAHNEHIIRMGSCALPEPIALAERRALWADLDRRFAIAEGRWPGRISATDRRRILAQLEARIPRPIDSPRSAKAKVSRTEAEPEPA